MQNDLMFKTKLSLKGEYKQRITPSHPALHLVLLLALLGGDQRGLGVGGARLLEHGRGRHHGRGGGGAAARVPGRGVAQRAVHKARALLLAVSRHELLRGLAAAGLLPAAAAGGRYRVQLMLDICCCGL